MKAHREAEGIRRELAERRPDTYRSHLANTLNNLGTTLTGFRLVARRGRGEGVSRGRGSVTPGSWPRGRFDTYRPHLAMTLNNLGNALRDLGDPEGAVNAHREAEGIRRELAVRRPDIYRPDLATTLNNLGPAAMSGPTGRPGEPHGEAAPPRGRRVLTGSCRAAARRSPAGLGDHPEQPGDCPAYPGGPWRRAAKRCTARPEGIRRELTVRRPDAYRPAPGVRPEQPGDRPDRPGRPRRSGESVS